ncbi:MAG: hypothetical protein AAB288_14475, partial [Acidobacteriota bacterium]
MKYALFLIAVLCFVSLPVLAQTGGPRPRTSATPKTPPTVQNETPATQRQKPSLGGSTILPPPPPSPAQQKAMKKEEDEVIVVDTDLVTTPVSVMDR